MTKPRVLFILKKRQDYGTIFPYSTSTGLSNSVQFLVDMFTSIGIESKQVTVLDNNGIDKEVYAYKPTHVIIEALWVVPSKFDELLPLHPGVQWIVRLHSQLPFMAIEGVAFEWIMGYLKYQDVSVASNADEMTKIVRDLAGSAHPNWSDRTIARKVLLLPNFYPYDQRNPRNPQKDPYVLDIGCFGAIRPFKNHLMQAIAAMNYANDLKRPLRFHINDTRKDSGGEAILRNLQAIFANTGHQLVTHDWATHDDFLAILGDMDIGMQVSFSETFNIVSADMVITNLPIVVSDEISWADPKSFADPNDIDSIGQRLSSVNHWLRRSNLLVSNRKGLKQYCERSKHIWRDYLS